LKNNFKLKIELITKTHTNIVIKYWFEIFANCDWLPKSLLHCVLLEICHVTLVLNLACI